MDIDQFLKVLTQMRKESKPDEEMDLLSIQEVCKFAGVSRWTVHRWIKKGYLRAYKMSPCKSGRVRIKFNSLLELLSAFELPYINEK